MSDVTHQLPSSDYYIHYTVSKCYTIPYMCAIKITIYAHKEKRQDYPDVILLILSCKA